MAIETNVDIEVTPEMLAAGLKALRELGVIKRPTVAHEVLVAGIYKAMARSRHSEAAVEVTVPGVLEPGTELVVKNETDHPIRVVADPHERLKLKTRARP